jgi:heat-inducible transcriptional repressor
LYFNKKKIILYSIINEYIKDPSPIGSEQLKVIMDIDVSSATIRNYFKKLSNDGELKQLHTSSGRVPTSEALKNYWQDKIPMLFPIKFNSITNMTKLSKQLDIFYIYRFATSNILKKIINVDNEFLLLIFSDNQIAVNYNKKIEKFLQDFIGSSIDSLNSVLENVGIFSISKKIDNHNIKNAKHSNAKKIMELIVNRLTSEEIGNSILNAKILDSKKNGIYFDDITPSGYMAIKDDVLINNRPAKFFCLGKLSSDFNIFLKG